MAIKISVVIPYYNQREYIERSVYSVLNQENKNFEIIIIDDGSTDEGLNDIKKINSDKIKIYRTKNQGVSHARNYGASQSNYDVIAFLDSDDEWLQGYISSIIELIKKYPNAAAYAMKAIVKNNNTTIDYNIISNDFNSFLIRHPLKFLLKYPRLICASNVIIKKNIFMDLNGFKNNVVWGEDQDLWYRIAIDHSIAYRNITSAIIHITGNWDNKLSERIKKNPEHPFIESGLQVIKNKKISLEIKRDIKNMIEMYKIKSAKYNMQIGEFNKAQEILLTCGDFYHWNKILLMSWLKLPDFILRKKLYNVYSHTFAFIKNKILLKKRLFRASIDSRT